MHAPEWSEQVRRRVCRTLTIVEKADQYGEPERTCQQHDFVVSLVGFFPKLGDEGATLPKFVFGQFHFAGEVMEMADGCRYDLLDARIADPLQFAQDSFGDLLLVLDDHART